MHLVVDLWNRDFSHADEAVAGEDSTDNFFSFDSSNDRSWEQKDGHIVKMVRKNFGPDANAVITVVDRLDDLQGQMDTLVGGTECIQTLFLAGHGEVSHSQGTDKDKKKLKNYSIDFRVAQDYMTVRFMENEKGEIRTQFATTGYNPFGGLKGKFCPGARVTLEQCQLMKGNEHDVQVKFKGLARDVFGLESGQIYSNYTDSSDAFYRYYMQFATDAPTTKGKLKILTAQVLAPLFIPLTLFQGTVTNNRGYFYDVESEKVTTGSLVSAINQQFPEGEE